MPLFIMASISNKNIFFSSPSAEIDCLYEKTSVARAYRNASHFRFRFLGSKDFHDVKDLDSPLSLPVRQGASIAQSNNIVQKLVQKYSHMAITKQPHKLGGSIQE